MLLRDNQFESGHGVAKVAFGKTEVPWIRLFA